MKKENGILSDVNEEDLDLLEEDSEEFWKDVKIIGFDAFTECELLTSINLGDNVEVIEGFAFYGCNDLKNVKVSSKLKKVLSSAFAETGVEKVDWLNGLQELPEDMFNSCKKLKEIVIPSNVKKINERALFNCEKLENVKLEEGIEMIDSSAFGHCKSLKGIHIPSSVKIIKENAFTCCESLKIINIPLNVNLEKNAFPYKKDYEQIYLYDLGNIFNQDWITAFIDPNISTIYKNEKTAEYLIQNNNNIKEIKEGFNVFNGLDKYIKKFKCNRKVASICYEADLKVEDLEEKQINSRLVNEVISKENINKFKEIYTCKEFNAMLKRINKKVDIYSKDLFTFAYNLGAFDSDGKVRQRACNFIENLFDKGLLNENNISYIFNSMNLKGFNPEWTDFIMNRNYTKMLFEKESEKSGFIAKTYNNFDSIKKFNTSNKGEQREKKVTLDICEKYLDINMFDNVSENTRDIALVISDYTRNQESFDTASEIREEYLKKREKGEIKDHILDEELKEKDVFDSIEEIKETILNDTNSTLNSLNELANKQFTYEFLSKYDPRNFVLGKYCSCCAHLEGTGFGIMKASILNPDCQNLIIKDKCGKIIAKSTLYVNREQGYVVYNNVEISKLCNKEDRKLIYIKYKEATEKFVNKYNEINKDKPITQVNVGMHLNDLSAEIRKKNERSTILEGVDFSTFGKESSSYKGDWYEEQYVMWKKTGNSFKT